ncbi:MAG: MotA/TolQ/ExbB proton channel family protein [Candidatus Caenarcaniphilales bacterium]|nr:MotA/TolQ/ExbB proton channel family protein [Candidatus Caenarcaniphilales bacterium]
MPEDTSSTNVILEYFISFFTQDWFASLPILACAIATLAVAIERSVYYSRNRRDMRTFIRRLQQNLEKGNIDLALNLARDVGGLIGQVTEEGLRLVRYQARSFNNAFDISVNLFIRDLEKRLSVLATIGATCPFIGLFGTVVGVIVTLKILGEKGGQTSEVVVGVAKALIATGFGLIVAIIAVIINNAFNSSVRSFENDFQLIKLTLLDYLNSGVGQMSSNNTTTPSQTAAAPPPVTAQSGIGSFEPAGQYYNPMTQAAAGTVNNTINSAPNPYNVPGNQKGY